METPVYYWENCVWRITSSDATKYHGRRSTESTTTGKGVNETDRGEVVEVEPVDEMVLSSKERSKGMTVVVKLLKASTIYRVAKASPAPVTVVVGWVWLEGMCRTVSSDNSICCMG